MNRHWLRYGVVFAATTFLILAQDQKTPPWAYALNPPATPGAAPLRQPHPRTLP